MVVFCITCKGRSQHIKQTLPKNLADNEDFPDCKFVLLNYGSPDDLVRYVMMEHRSAIGSGRLVLYLYPDTGAFRMAHAKNMAHRLGILEGADVLVNLDADNFTGPGFAEYVAKQFERERIFLWSGIVKGRGKRFRGTSGRIACTKKAFECAGGYDEQYQHWGPDDKDFNARLAMLGYEPCEIREEFLEAVPHTDGKRFEEYPHVRETVASGECPIEPFRPVVNCGRFGCGTVYRNLCDRIELRELPTRIFGIGMHKTATTSLFHALEILGYEAAHWKSPRWAKNVWQEMTRWGWSLTLERAYTLCDLPITVLYKELDRGYPGSKFILTTREESGWLKTVERHWDPAYNPFRESWDNDAFSHRMHQILYGRTDFHAETMLARYRRHNAEVLEYFKDRPGDLLVMDMDFGWPKRNDEGAGWHELCGFLGKSVPSVPYPRAFASY